MKYTHTLKYQLKNLLKDKISKRLLELEFKSNHSIITKALKRVVEKVFAIAIKHGLNRKKKQDLLL